MGVIFQRQPRYEAIKQHIDAALGEEPPADAQAREDRATELAREASQAGTAGVAVNWSAFGVAFAIFAALLGLAIVLDWQSVVKDAAPYTGLAGTALGAVLGFLTGDAAATLSES